ncbi:MAG: CCA tRNA nucleotidyltransferase [Deltaproteobacteria bacterium]|nr:CCA tRNA nucleotidyltransferase [Deltaproteobacteria bacterium]
MSAVKPIIVNLQNNEELLKKIDPDAIKIIKRLVRFNYKAYLVGGCVRDLLLNREPKDFDIVTDAWPKRIRSLFHNSRIIGKRFQLVHVIFGDRIIEVSTFRQEDKSPPKITKEGTIRKSENRYGTEETDAFRRDLTINSLFLDPIKGQIIDYTGGYNDLIEGKIRVIGNPVTRFNEDPVRILRALRHSFRTGFAIQKDVIDAVSICKTNLPTVSGHRIFDELKKDVQYGKFFDYFNFLKKFGVSQVLFPTVNFPEVDDNALVLLKHLCTTKVNQSSELTVLIIFCALNNINLRHLPPLNILNSKLHETFKICSPPRICLSRAFFLLTLVKRLSKLMLGKTKKKNFKVSEDTAEAFKTLLETLAPDMLQYFANLNESHRYNSS